MTVPMTSSPGLSPYRDSVSLDFPELVVRLRDLLGARLVAYLGDVKETRAVRQWAAGEWSPSGSVEQRLRLAFQVAGLIAESKNSHAIVQAWFQGANPQLDDRSPAHALHEESVDAISPQVIAAARAFARVG